MAHQSCGALPQERQTARPHDVRVHHEERPFEAAFRDHGRQGAALGTDLAPRRLPGRLDRSSPHSTRGLAFPRFFDYLGPSDIRSLPTDGRVELIALHHEIERLGQWP